MIVIGILLLVGEVWGEVFEVVLLYNFFDVIVDDWCVLYGSVEFDYISWVGDNLLVVLDFVLK